MKLNYYAIQKNINEWDPMGIIFYRDRECTQVLNPDEYKSEIEDIFDKCDYVKKNDVAGLAKVISEVFEEWFDRSFSIKKCLPIAQKIFDDSHKS